jgi:hypothetical protein
MPIIFLSIFTFLPKINLVVAKQAWMRYLDSCLSSTTQFGKGKKFLVLVQ